MPQARKRLVSLEVTPFYHVIARCVRRHFLCGKDPLTGKDYSARKQDIQDRLALLAEVFAIDVCAYAILSNHYHLVLHVDEQSALPVQFIRFQEMPVQFLLARAGTGTSRAH